MKKCFIAVLTLILVGITLIGCGSSNSGNSRGLPQGTVAYFGTQVPGDAWEVLLYPDNTFKATNMTTSKTFSGDYTTNSNGVMSFVVKNQDGQALNPTVTVYGSQISSTALSLLPPGTNNNPIIAYAEGASGSIDKCSTLTSDHIGIRIPTADTTIASDSPAYAKIKTTASSPNYAFSMDVYNLDGSFYDTQGEGATFTCTNGVLKSAQKPVYVVIAESGAFVADLGTDGGIAGVQVPSAAIDVTALSTKNFIATYSHANAGTSVVGGASQGEVAKTLVMGNYANPATDSTHGTQFTINFSAATQETAGLILGATVNGHPAVMVANTVNNKAIVLGLSTDQSDSDPIVFTLMEK